MNSNSYSFGGYKYPEPNEKVLKQIEELGFICMHDNKYYHPDNALVHIDISHTEENGIVPLLYETYFLAGYKKKEDEIKTALGIS